MPVAGWPSESWPWARPCTWRHSQARGAVFDQSPMAPPIVHPVKVYLAAGFCSGSRHPSKGWVRPKQAGWEFRVWGSAAPDRAVLKNGCIYGFDITPTHP